MEIALRRLRSEQFLRETERRARKARVRLRRRDGARARHGYHGEEDEEEVRLGSRAIRGDAVREDGGGGKPRWRVVGTTRVASGVDAEGALVPLFRDEETRRTNVARARAPQVDGAERVRRADDDVSLGIGGAAARR